MASKERIGTADAIVIGAGIMGASIAFQLARAGKRKIILIDERAPIGGMSGRTFGQVRQHYSNEILIKLAIRGFEVLANWQREVGCGDSGYQRLGYLLLVVKAQLEACKRNVALGQSLGVDTRFVGPDEIKQIEPMLVTDDLAGGAYEPNGGYIDVTRMILSWLSAAQGMGLSFMSGVTVKAIETRSGRVTGVDTSLGRIDAPIVIAATNAWARDLLSPIGVDVPIKRMRLDMAILRQGLGKRQVRTCITDGNSNVVLRPDLGPYAWVVAYPPAMPEVVDPLGEAPADEIAQHRLRMDKAFAARLPDYVGAEIVRSVSGVYDVTPDYHPILGWAGGIEGLCLAIGFSGHGLKLAPAIGEVIAATVLDQEPAFDISPLRFSRFAEGKLMFLAYGPSARA
ncbi:MAG: FAD-binding oxidoreductase [Alphaproteobacteria bacterium]|nr:FAD-binding oxidoreductase [Alphaproteobacteria bacterium]